MGRYNPEVHHRRSIRLKSYDYSGNGVYFVTICVQGRLEVFGTIDDGVMEMNEYGTIVQNVWESLPGRFPGTDIDAFVVMPNHVHGIIVRTEDFTGEQHVKDKYSEISTNMIKKQHGLSLKYGTLQIYANTPDRWQRLGEMVRTFKAATCRLIRKDGYTRFAWQRNYYEHIIRNEQDLHALHTYIDSNPQTWHKDTLNPTP